MRGGLNATSIAAALALVALLAGCGGEDGTAGTGGASPDAAPSPSGERGRSPVEERGAEGTDAERAQAARTARAYLNALAAGRWGRACSRFSAATREGLGRLAAKDGKRKGSGPRTCPQILRTIYGRADRSSLREAAEIDASGIRVDGARGYLLYADGAGTPSSISMDRERGRWWVADIGGGRLAPEAGSPSTGDEG